MGDTNMPFGNNQICATASASSNRKWDQNSIDFPPIARDSRQSIRQSICISGSGLLPVAENTRPSGAISRIVRSRSPGIIRSPTTSTRLSRRSAWVMVAVLVDAVKPHAAHSRPDCHPFENAHAKRPSAGIWHRLPGFFGKIGGEEPDNVVRSCFRCKCVIGIKDPISGQSLSRQPRSARHRGSRSIERIGRSRFGRGHRGQSASVRRYIDFRQQLGRFLTSERQMGVTATKNKPRSSSEFAPL